MSATVMCDKMMIPTTAGQNDVELVKCDCCGLTEECTAAYIERIRERYSGKWICGLCSEAVKDEVVRSPRLINTEEAISKHLNFCNKFRSAGPPKNPSAHLITAMRRLLRRSLESHNASSSSPRSMPSSPNARV